MSRIERLRPDEMDEQQRRLYDQIVGGPRAKESAFALTDDEGALEGPFNLMLLEPALGEAVQSIGAAIRFSGRLSAVARECLILLVAAKHNCEFEQTAHEAVARRLGLDEPQLVQLRAGAVPQLDDDVNMAACRAGAQLISTGQIDEQTYQSVITTSDAATMFEIVTLINYYNLLAQLMRVFDADHPAQLNR